MLLRVQDKSGRGPFRPGFTKQWCEYNHSLPSLFEEFPDLLSKTLPLSHAGMSLGVAVRGWEGIKKWFSGNELKKLEKFGFKVVEVKNYRIVCESEHQLVFAAQYPLTDLAEKQP